MCALPVRIAVRKIPPSVTEEEFRALKPITKILSRGGSVQFYPAEIVGQTAAPASAFAVVTLSESELGGALTELEGITFQQPYDTSSNKTYHPVVELAPIKVLSTISQIQEKARVADIDDDPEFVAFAKNYETGFIPETDAVISAEEMNEPEYDAEKLEALWRNRPGNGQRGKAPRGRGGKGRGNGRK